MLMVLANYCMRPGGKQGKVLVTAESEEDTPGSRAAAACFSETSKWTHDPGTR
jgi:hypothetical protein